MVQSNEVEVKTAETFKKFGCPYSTRDPRGIIWMDGFRAGIEHSVNKLMESKKP